MTCFYCGTELPAGAMFCGECGRPVNTRGGRSPRGANKAATERAAEVPSAEPAVEVPAAEVAPAEVPPAEVPAAEAPAAEAPAAVLAADEPAAAEAPAAEPAAEAAPEEPAAADAESIAPTATESSEREPVVPEPAAPPAETVDAEPAPEAVPVEALPAAVPAEVSPAEVSAPQPEPAAVPQPAATPEPEPQPGRRAGLPAHDATAAAERCAQCGAPLAPTDIFCPECGFVRQRGSARSRPSDTNVLDPFPWGLPRPTEPVASPPPAVAFEPDLPPRAVATDAAAHQFVEVADVAETRLVPRGPRGERFVLQFSTGESVSVSGSGLIGRNPVAEPGEYFDTLVAVVDPGRSVSKTHLEFGQDGSSFWVSDRYSGNGTVVREPDREPRRCEAGKRYRVVRGARVEIGEQFFIVS